MSELGPLNILQASPSSLAIRIVHIFYFKLIIDFLNVIGAIIVLWNLTKRKIQHIK